MTKNRKKIEREIEKGKKKWKEMKKTREKKEGVPNINVDLVRRKKEKWGEGGRGEERRG